MNDGFVMSHNSESIETKEFPGLEKVLSSSEFGVRGGEVKKLDLTLDDEIKEAMSQENNLPKVLETPKKNKDGVTTRDCNTSYTLGSAMKELDIEMKTEMFLPE